MENKRAMGLILDGNRRWAKKHNKTLKEAYTVGISNLYNVHKELANNGFSDVVAFAFSTENWSRDKEEIDFLFQALRDNAEKMKEVVKENNIEVSFFGDIEKFDDDIQERLKDIENTTRGGESRMHIALSYGSRADIVRACNLLITKGKATTEEEFSKSLSTINIGNIEGIIRTGGNKRLSNFLLWEASYAELHFTDTLWQDFSKEELGEIIMRHNKRRTNFGK